MKPELPPADWSPVGTEYGPVKRPTSIDGGKVRPPIADEVRLLRERFPEVVGFIEDEAIRLERARATAALNRIPSLTDDGVMRVRLDRAILAVSRDE